MLRVVPLLLILSAVESIIVRDPPSPRTDEYKYSYEVEDPSTGDQKRLQEVRLGDLVSGSYSVVDPDGTRRTVEYTAHPQHGFKAVVTQEPVAPVVPRLEATKRYTSVHDDAYQSVQLGQFSTSPGMYYTNAKDNKPSAYFTPANEIRSDEETFAPGQYFIPNNELYQSRIAI